jgi:hypothetical protein
MQTGSARLRMPFGWYCLDVGGFSSLLLGGDLGIKTTSGLFDGAVLNTTAVSAALGFVGTPKHPGEFVVDAFYVS